MKTSTFSCLLPIGLALFVIAGPTSANLIVNGDFETGTFASWTTTPAPVGSDFGVGQVPPPHDTLGAFFGAFDTDFDSISQTFVTTPGAFYGLSFFYQRRRTPFLRFYHHYCAEPDGIIKLARLPMRHPNASV
jgi:hypothetical protein